MSRILNYFSHVLTQKGGTDIVREWMSTARHRRGGVNLKKSIKSRGRQ